MPNTVNQQSDGFEVVNAVSHLPVTEERSDRIRRATDSDQLMRLLKESIQHGWPEKDRVSPQISAYHGTRDELAVTDGLVFRGERLVVPKGLKRLIMCDIHLGHSGIEGCLKRARESVYWPGMTADIREHIQGCEICNEYAQGQQKEPLMSHEVPTRPWQRVATDLFTFDGNEYLITVCYYSNFWEIDRLYGTASETVIHKLKSHFPRYGKPDELISDNGPQFSSAKFQKFMRDWDITHNTSSPHYPQSNGKAESAVKTAKRMMRKTTNEDQYLALLSIRNTPQQGIDLSPAQRLMGRRTKTLVPATHTLLKMQTSRRDTVDKLTANQRRQQLYYNQAANVLPDLEKDDMVQ